MRPAARRPSITVVQAGMLAGTALLIVGLAVFPWYSEGGVRVANLSVSGFSASATSSPYALWGIIAIALAALIAADLLREWLLPAAIALPLTPPSRELARAIGYGVIVVALAVKFVAHVGDFGWGLYVDAVLAIAVAVGGFLTLDGESSAGSAEAQ